jgi:hypothetical protein
MKTHSTFMLVALVLAVCWFGVQASAVTLLVSSAADNGPNTLRSAIQTAIDGDVITFAAGLGTITISSGEMVIQHDVTISGPGQTNLTIVGASLHDRVFEIIPKLGGSPPSVAISRLRFTGGYSGANGPAGTPQSRNGTNGTPALGGIIYNHGLLAITNCLFEQCYATGGNGGDGFWGIVGTFNPPGDGGNGAPGCGGAIAADGSLVVYGCTFLSNSVSGGNGGAGTNGTGFKGSNGGSAGSGTGGAICISYNGSPALTALNCTFVYNIATGGDGGHGGDGAPGLPGGTGGDGGYAEAGAIYHGGLCTPPDCGSMVHCTVSQNYILNGFGGAGGAGNPAGAPGVDGSGVGGGVFFLSRLLIGNSIIAGNGCLGSGSCSSPEVNGNVMSLGHNLIGALNLNTSSGWTITDFTGDLIVPMDPHLGLPQYNGGETPTMAPLADSPAIDTGSTDGLVLDQAGQMRPVIVQGILNGGDGSDMGAYETQCSFGVPALSITKSGMNLLLSWPWPSRCWSLQQTSDLLMPNWVDSAFAITVVGTQNQVNLPPQAGNLFFRLKK